MKYCSNCGNEVDSNAAICVKCGVQLRPLVNNNSINDNGSLGWSLLGFFVPVAGLVLWLVWKDCQPNNSKAAKKGFLAYLIFMIIILILSFIIPFFIISSFV